MATEATYVYDHVGLGDGHPLSCLALGAAAFMVGDEDEAVRRLREGADTTLDRPLVVANCLAHLAMIDVEHGRWREATAAARPGAEAARRRRRVRRARSSSWPSACSSRPMRAGPTRSRRTASCAASTSPASSASRRGSTSRPASRSPARRCSAGDSVEAAAPWSTRPTPSSGRLPGAVGVAEQLAALRREIAAARDRSQRFGPSSLTTAELRVLQLLPTHLSVGRDRRPPVRLPEHGEVADDRHLPQARHVVA